MNELIQNKNTLYLINVFSYSISNRVMSTNFMKLLMTNFPRMFRIKVVCFYQ